MQHEIHGKIKEKRPESVSEYAIPAYDPGQCGIINSVTDPAAELPGHD